MKRLRDWILTTAVIASRDFRGFFMSPRGATIAWFFLGLMGVVFWSYVQNFEDAVRRAPEVGGQAPTLEQFLRVIFLNAQFVLMLLVPAVTMQAFAEERRQNTLRLLLSAPVTSAQIVLGKYAALMTFLGLTLAASAVFPGFLVRYGNPDLGVILTGYVGLFLVVAAQVAFGLWVSSLAASPMMAFVFTMFGLFFLMLLGWLAPELAEGGWSESLVRWFAMNGHLDSFFRGALSVRDIVYFAVFAMLFLFFAQTSLEAERRK